MSLKDNWKDAGKGVGKSFAGLGKSILKSVKVGVERATDEEPVDENGNPKKTNLKEAWSEVGHNFGNAGKSIGKAAAGTVKKVADKVDEAAEEDGKTTKEN